MNKYLFIMGMAGCMVSSQIIASGKVNTDPSFYTLPEAYWAQSLELIKAPEDKVSEEAKQLNDVLNILEGKRSSRTVEYGRWLLKSAVNLNQIESSNVANVNYCYAYLAKPMSSIREVTKSEKLFRKAVYNKCSLMAKSFFLSPEFDFEMLATTLPELKNRKANVLGYLGRGNSADLLLGYPKQMVFKRMTVQLKSKRPDLPNLEAPSVSYRLGVRQVTVPQTKSEPILKKEETDSSTTNGVYLNEVLGL